MKNYANVGITRNLAQSFLLYTNTTRFLQTFILHRNVKCLTRKFLCKTTHSAKSAKLCKRLIFLQTFAVKIPLLSFTGKTVQMRTGTNHPNRRKSFIFTEKSLPDFVASFCVLATYANRKISFFCIFLQIYRKSTTSLLSTKMNQKNQNLRIRNAELQLPISEQNFFALHCIKNNKKPSTTQKALNRLYTVQKGALHVN